MEIRDQLLEPYYIVAQGNKWAVYQYVKETAKETRVGEYQDLMQACAEIIDKQLMSIQAPMTLKEYFMVKYQKLEALKMCFVPPTKSPAKQEVDPVMHAVKEEETV